MCLFCGVACSCFCSGTFFFTMIVHLAGHGIPEKLCSNFGDLVRNKFHTALMIPITESKQISNPFPGDFPSFVEKLLEGFLSNDTKYTLCESDMFKHFWQLFPKNYMGYTKYVAQIDSLEQPVLNFESPMCSFEIQNSIIMNNLRENMRVNIWTRSQESSKFFLLPWLSQLWQFKNFEKKTFYLHFKTCNLRRICEKTPWSHAMFGMKVVNLYPLLVLGLLRTLLEQVAEKSVAETAPELKKKTKNQEHLTLHHDEVCSGDWWRVKVLCFDLRHFLGSLWPESYEKTYIFFQINLRALNIFFSCAR